ncbi:HpcH/HpaI aldolase family protein [Aspergillus neoniger CBS 115656]|uniref:2,4-dihydroxyhept-2-ene-1,7-dioic acid aldolase n=1 Tax=Aspergillus neoniger (strain CBS 115656) TaxID=1448310 RepID=A0A318Y3V5_ASPNB|nr:2,4-dihydroxyhept-2-ene-1,7-dioic acid aldolase [Aspergillus neoniger CBS 115656]PYH28137.1 2,4-dihydroxyhept-2-ene-1,7-dioic acid aldolase [Aspergillus neoniger CBS 115656]
MQAANRLQKALNEGHSAYGAWQMLPGANLTRAICRSASNIDWLLVDLEHGNISDDSMHDIVAAAAACGVSPVVQVIEGQQWMIKRALDSGAHGILVPVLESVQDARNIVKYSKFPPLGTRGFEPLLAVEKFAQQHPHGGGVRQLTGREYLEQANTSLVIAVQIETRSALDQVKEIAAVPGIDVLFIGPFDLGVSIGHPIVNGRMDEVLIDSIISVHEAAQSAGKRAGIYCDSGQDAKEWADRGFLMNSAVTDLIGLQQVMSQEFEAAR